jgi:hypothetical protein
MRSSADLPVCFATVSAEIAVDSPSQGCAIGGAWPASGEAVLYLLPLAHMADAKFDVVVLEPGVELLDIVREGDTRVVVYRDSRDGVYHWYELEFLHEGAWQVIFRIGDTKIQEAIDLFTKAKKLAA